MGSSTTRRRRSHGVRDRPSGPPTESRGVGSRTPLWPRMQVFRERTRRKSEGREGPSSLPSLMGGLQSPWHPVTHPTIRPCYQTRLARRAASGAGRPATVGSRDGRLGAPPPYRAAFPPDVSSRGLKPATGGGGRTPSQPRRPERPSPARLRSRPSATSSRGMVQRRRPVKSRAARVQVEGGTGVVWKGGWAGGAQGA